METFIIYLKPMTLNLAKALFDGFQNDPDLYEDPGLMKPYEYNESAVEAYVNRQKALGRIHFAIMHHRDPIGEILLKNIEPGRCCTLSIHLKNNNVKNMGYGTEAERQAIDYAFRELKMNYICADALIKNTRSRHVLEKLGFTEVRRNEIFVYYELYKSQWLHDTVH